MYPQSEMTEYQGHWYCKDHYQPKILKERLFIPVDIQEEIPDGDSVGSDFVAEIPDTYGNTDR